MSKQKIRVVTGSCVEYGFFVVDKSLFSSPDPKNLFSSPDPKNSKNLFN